MKAKPKTFKEYLEQNPYQYTRSFTKEEWENSMWERWEDDKKEETKQETTLEEAMNQNGYHESDYDKIWREGVEFGTKWQQERMYSEEEAITNIELAMIQGLTIGQYRDLLIEQFKKK